ncbi:hypothetical protein FACS1894162_7970 [Bacteroidia bacterium]|nr:hypothetical protein FACS1894162_7970 [Bacteroidia bacterium]
MRTKNLLSTGLLGLLFLSSCADDLYQTKPLQSSGKEISFKTFADKQLRASVTTASSMTSFTTSAWSHPAATPTVYDGYVLNGVTVTRGEEDGAGVNNWEYFPKAGWPATGEVDFFAYSPASSVNIVTGLKSTAATPAAGGPEIVYTVPGWDGGGTLTVDQQEDFLVTKSVDLTYTSSPTVQLNFKHALSRIVFKAQNQNQYKTYVIKELALSNLKSKGTLNMLDSLPNAADPFLHVAGAYNISWQSQSDPETYKVDLGSTNVYVPYGTTSADYTAITNASNGLMVLPQETELGAFTGSTPEYGTAAEVDPALTDATYLYATVAEVNYLTNDTVNTRQVVFRLHDPADKTLGIVFEAGKQYTFLLTLGLDGGVISFSVPSVTDFNKLTEVDLPETGPAPWKCGDLINGYTTANYNNPGLTNLCWTTTNLAEVTPNVVTTFTGHAAGERGFYYPQSDAATACAALGVGWSVPSGTQWSARVASWGGLVDGTVGGKTSVQLQDDWDAGGLGGYYYVTSWIGWGDGSYWWSADTAFPLVEEEPIYNHIVAMPGPLLEPTFASVRCVSSM